jgi:histidinol-phosphate aminotransferase
MTTIQGMPDLGAGLRLHLNENTGGCSPRVIEAVRGIDAQAMAVYPDYHGAVLDTAAYLHVDPERLVLTNGLDEGILLVAMAYLGARTPKALVELGASYLPLAQPEVVCALPAFEPYVTTTQAMGARFVAVKPGPDFAFPLQGVLDAITPNTRLVYINNPNNPSGVPISKSDIRRVAEAAGHAVVFVDEAYHDFMGENFLDEAGKYPNVLVGRTFSKAYGLAGIRVGAMIASPAILEPIRFVMPLFNLNVAAVVALRAALADGAYMPWYLDQAAESKALVYEACDRLGLRYWKSSANFVLIDGGARARHLIDGLIAGKIFVRDRTMDPECANCFRLTTGLVDHTRAAVTLMDQLCAAR